MISVLAIAIGVVLVLTCVEWYLSGRVVRFASTNEELLDLFTNPMQQ